MWESTSSRCVLFVLISIVQVLLFLAAAWPISEKSAVNLKGTSLLALQSACRYFLVIPRSVGDVHLENVTTFEDKAGFETAQAEEMALSMDCTETVSLQSFSILKL